jgi:hypothetical protein
MQGRAQLFAQAIQGRAQRLLRRSAAVLGPQQRLQLLAHEWAGMCREVIEQGTTLAPQNGQRLAVAHNLRGSQQLDR